MSCWTCGLETLGEKCTTQFYVDFSVDCCGALSVY